MPGSVSPPVGRLDSLDVIVRARSTTNDGFTLSLVQSGAFGTEVSFYRPGATTPTCAVFSPYLPGSPNPSVQTTIAVDLFSAAAQAVPGLPKCNNVTPALTRADLQGAGVDVVHRLAKDISFGIYSSITNTIQLDGFELRAGWDLRPSSAVGGSGWGDPANTLITDTAHSGYSRQCNWFGDSCPSDTRSVTVSGFDNVARPHVPTD